MVKRVLVVAGLVTALAGGAVVSAMAQGPGGPGFGRGPRGGMRGGPGAAAMLPLRGVDLTDAQREQVRAIMESHKGEFDQVRTKMREAHQAIAAASTGQNVDEGAIRTAATALGVALGDQAILRAKVRGEVFGILTAEQQQTLQERQSERAKRRRQ